MKLTDDRTEHTSVPPVPEDAFERLRETFYARLRSDQLRLTTLAASLARIDGNSAGIFSALQSLAHRIRGAAAIFEALEVSSAAYALEQAAIAAGENCADHMDEAVWSTLEDLVERMASACGGAVARARPLRPPPHSRRLAQHPQRGPGKKRSRQAKDR